MIPEYLEKEEVLNPLFFPLAAPPYKRSSSPTAAEIRLLKKGTHAVALFNFYPSLDSYEKIH
jgi:hypothetical protein